MTCSVKQWHGSCTYWHFQTINIYPSFLKPRMFGISRFTPTCPAGSAISISARHQKLILLVALWNISQRVSIAVQLDKKKWFWNVVFIRRWIPLMEVFYLYSADYVGASRRRYCINKVPSVESKVHFCRWRCRRAGAIVGMRVCRRRRRLTCSCAEWSRIAWRGHRPAQTVPSPPPAR